MGEEEYISKEKLLKIFKMQCETCNFTECADKCIWPEAVDVIKNAPAEDVTPVKHGHWIVVEEDACERWVDCSVCGCRDRHTKVHEIPYCWHYGARMGNWDEV